MSAIDAVDYAALPPKQIAQVDAVVARLTREPMTGPERVIAINLYPGKRARWLTAYERRFLRDLARRMQSTDDVDTAMTLKQRNFFWRIVVRYQRRLSDFARHVARHELDRRQLEGRDV